MATQAIAHRTAHSDSPMAFDASSTFTDKSNADVGHKSKTKRSRIDFGVTIKVIAGDVEQPIVVHKDIICRRSDYFVAACSKAWAEDGEKPIRLQSIDSDTFSLFVAWAYTGKIDNNMINEPGPSLYKDALDGHAAWRLTRLYVAADMLLAGDLRRDVIDEIVRWPIRSGFLNAKVTTYAWEHTIPDAGLRRLIVDTMASTMALGAFRQYRPLLCDELLLDVACRALDVVKPRMPMYADRCQYHDHMSNEERAACAVACSRAIPQQLAYDTSSQASSLFGGSTTSPFTTSPSTTGLRTASLFGGMPPR